MSSPEPATDTLRLPVGQRRLVGRSKLLWVAFLPAVAFIAAVAVVDGSLPSRIVVGAGLLALTLGVHRYVTRRRDVGAWLVVDGDGIKRIEGESERRVVGWSDPLGVTVLASSDHPIVLLGITTPRTARYFWAPVVVGSPREAAPTLFSHALPAADGDIRADDANVLTPSDMERLLVAITRRAPGALDRVYLSDSTGDAIVLDRGVLQVGGRRIDLTDPLEWRAFIFQERGAVASSLSQAMWVRQADAEFVLVSPVTEGAWIRFAKASAGEPPPRELRRAVDRLFMVPLARALTRAGRASRAPSAPRRSMQKTPSA